MAVLLSLAQQRALQAIQAALLANVAKAAGAHGSLLRTKVRKLQEQIEKGASLSEIKASVKRIVRFSGRKLGLALRGLLASAATYAQRYQRRLEQYAASRAGTVDIGSVKAAKLGGSAAKAAYTYAGRRAKGLLAQAGSKALSRNLHMLTRAEADEVTRRVVRSIQEAQSLQFASRELVDAAGVGAKDKLPGLLRKVQRSARKMDLAAGGELTMERRKLVKMARQVASGRKPGGRLQAAYVELAQDLAKKGAAQKAVEKWVYQKQRYRAETILWTETAGAYRLKQAELGAKKPWIVGYRVKMTRGRHSRFVATKPGRLKALGGAHCLCEVYDGKVISKEEYRSRWFMGFHPRCGCNFIEVIDRKALLSQRGN